MSVLPKRLFHWSTLFARLNLIKNERYEKVLFSDIGHRPLRHGCAGAKFIRGHIGFGQHHVVRKGGELNVEVSLDLGAVKLAAQQMIVLTPVLRSTEGEEQQQLAPVVIAGPRRYRVLKRSLAFGTDI